MPVGIPDTTDFETLRRTEYNYLDAQDHVYLDYTGSGLTAASQVRHHSTRFATTLYGNPHSINPTSAAATEAIDRTKSRVLAHVNASPGEYTVVFTANATAAARLVGEAYPFHRGRGLVLTADNHNSINGIREFAASKGAQTKYIPLLQPDLRISHTDVTSALGPSRRLWRRLPTRCHCMLRRSSLNPKSAGLFAYPAQSNFSGVRHPLSWTALAQERGYHVLLDAAAYLPTATLDLSEVKPDFVIVSWYKLFGYPTGIGCLIARKESLDLLRMQRPWFSGGTIQAAAASVPWHTLAPGAEAFEDGTPNFLGIPDVHFGLDWLEAIGVSAIGARVNFLTGLFLDRLLQMHHSNGTPMVRVYGPINTDMRGGTITFNFLDAREKVIDDRLVGLESAAARISLRTGCFCNPGAGEAALGLDKSVVQLLTRPRKPLRKVDRQLEAHGVETLGAVRVSFGLASNTTDLDKFFGFAEKTYKDRIVVREGPPIRPQC
ncbi:molybdenum cofactor sulfurase [Dichotomopilus funicola]|uniref:Molybdenum cofactor sulfurase n=1 Tax=Dichotomopilus funicola TaxID=1934379 RepID=A0AAN6ZJ06_9PEZI|nr:molybdenum cofactor sulfurase [Dichotomopilus funicola]